MLRRNMHCKLCYKIGCSEKFYVFLKVLIIFCLVDYSAIFHDIHNFLQGNWMPYDIGFRNHQRKKVHELG